MPDGLTYRDAGVNLQAAEEATTEIGALVRATHGPEVPRGIGLFGALFDATALRLLEQPLLVSSLDGVGSKTMLAAPGQRDRLRTLGIDIVHHCVNDVAVQGAQPLFFLDYIAVEHLVSADVAAIVAGMAEACAAVGCALIGGETAEMPLLYRPGAHDVAGCLVGVVERSRLIDGSTIAQGDVVLGLPSHGLHTNGYSMALRLLPDLEQHAPAMLGESAVDALLEPHRCYLSEIKMMMNTVPVHGFAHITGGGLPGNLARIVPAGCAALLDASTWQTPPLFQLIQEVGHIAQMEMYRIFNMGIGLVAVVPRSSLAAARAAVPDAMPIGHIVNAGAVPDTVTIVTPNA